MTDNSAAESEECLMDVGMAFVTDAQAAELMQPAQSPFHHPACFAQTAAMRGVLTRQTIAHTPTLQPAMVSPIAIGAISLHQLGSLTRPTSFARYRWNRQQQRFERLAVVHVGGGQLRAQRNALGIGAKMMLAARFAAIRRVWSRLKPPKTARTLLESTTARDQSIRSALCSRRSNSRWSFSQTPAFCQSRSRRQQVMPLPQPISKGKSRQAIPLLSTNRIPISAARSDTGLRPGFVRRRFFFGINGSIIDHRELSNSALAIPLHRRVAKKVQFHFVTRSKSPINETP